MTEATTQTDDKSKAREVTAHILDRWATDPNGPVALHLKQRLLPVESLDGEAGIIYPPTYADIGYNIDTLSDGTNVALIDSVGSQANRMEPIFKAMPNGLPQNPLAELVPQIEIVFDSSKKSKENESNSSPEKRSILDLAHRSADAVVMSSPTLANAASKAFDTLRKTGDCAPLCALAPTSLVFGVWDSRGGSGEKRPRLVRAVVRAWDVEALHAAAQFNSVWKLLEEDQQEALKQEAKKQKKKLSEQGLADAPAVFRKTRIPEYRRDGMPNPEARVLGGVLVRGRIEREVTVNLVVLRGLRGENPEATECIRKYLLGLSLLVATADIDLFLREGCNLRYTGEDEWYEVPRRGEPQRTNLEGTESRMLIEEYAREACEAFRGRFQDKAPSDLEHTFDITEAKKLLAKKADEDSGEG